MRFRFHAFAAAGALAAAFASTSASAKDFDGPYVGAQAGLAVLHVEGSKINGPFESTDTTAFAAGVAGYRMPVGQGVVVGVEGDFGLHTDGGAARYGVSGIVGVKVGSGSLAYARIGYAWHDDLPPPVGKGLMVGGGFETRLTGPVDLRLDYKYLDLGRTDFPDNMLHYTGHEATAGFLVGF